MTDKELLNQIYQTILSKRSDYTPYEDLYYMSLEMFKQDIPFAVKYLITLSDMCEGTIQDTKSDRLIVKLYDLHKKVLRAAAPHDLDSFCLYIEWDREAKAKFYYPRRRILRPIANEMTRLENDELDLLVVSMPPGTGKTTMELFNSVWLGGKYPSKPILHGSHSNSLLGGMYSECLRIIQPDGEYLWHDVFPNIEIASTNAKDMRIDLGTSQRFETLEFSSVGSGNAGKVRAQKLLCCDDLVSGIEEALSKDQMDKKWEQYTTDLRQRKIGNCKELHVATPWSVHDVINRLKQIYADDPRAKFIAVPAMNEKDESNFDYGNDVGFTTEFYRTQRSIMDDASWRALYMCEPIEREGLVYDESELRRYYDLPEGEPDAIIAICDTKDKGKDYAFLPVGYIYGNDHYIEDCVCDNGLPDVVDERLAAILIKHNVKQARFESNSAGGRVAQKVRDIIKAKSGITHITTKFSTANKETKIIINSAWVKEHCLFKDKSKYTPQSDYAKMVNMLCGYTVVGKNKNDDVPDGMSMYAEYAQSLVGAKITYLGHIF